MHDVSLLRRWWSAPQLVWNSNAAPADRSQLGHHAKRLLDDPVLALALERIERRLVESWQNTPVGDQKTREAAYGLHWAVSQLRAELRSTLGDAKIIEKESELKAAQAERERQKRERF